jgi:hypothetical protein
MDGVIQRTRKNHAGGVRAFRIKGLHCGAGEIDLAGVKNPDTALSTMGDSACSKRAPADSRTA